MEIRNIYEPFSLELLETDHYTKREHRNTFFEMIFVLGGEGIQIINQNILPYQHNKLFLIFPTDTHRFEIHSTSKFFFIRFSDQHLENLGKEWMETIKTTFNSHNILPGCILKNSPDKLLVRSLVEALILEKAEQQLDHYHVSRQLINTIITIAARNINLQFYGNDIPPKLNLPKTIINYVQENIRCPEMLKASQISHHFSLSTSYVGEYFKKHSGENLQDFIIRHRIKLIEARLKFTTMRIGEIAQEFGFTDESHLHRTFKKHKSISPSAFRKLNCPS